MLCIYTGVEYIVCLVSMRKYEYRRIFVYIRYI